MQDDAGNGAGKGKGSKGGDSKGRDSKGGASGGHDAELQHELSCGEYMFYSVLAFLSYWFGEAYFDVDGDGTVDVEDVYAYYHRRQQRKAQKRAGGRRGQDPPASMAWGDSPKPEQVGHQQLGAPEEEALEDDVQGPVQEDMIRKNCRWPVFIVFQSLIATILWVVFAIRDMQSYEDVWSKYAGLDSFFSQSHATSLRLTDDCKDLRPQVWRWLTYQFTHVGINHVGMNSFLNLIMGVTQEAFHGTLRMALLYNVGVMGGAFAYIVSDAHNTIVGMSGGCYALIGFHYADLLLNWNNKKFRWWCLVLLVTLVVADLLNYFLSASDNTSNSAHFGGAIAGFIFGIVVARNIVQDAWERSTHVKTVALISGLILAAICLFWNFFTWAPRNIWESEGFCWLRLVYNPKYGPGWLCVACADSECVHAWSAEAHLAAGSHRVCNAIGWVPGQQGRFR